MKKMMSLFVCLSLLLSMGCMLGGCNSEQKKLVGTWQSEINYAPVVNTIIYSADSMKGVGDYFKLDSYTLLTTFTFWDDGTYTITVDPMEVFQSAQQIRNNMVNGMEQYLSDLIKEAGLNISPSAYLAMMGLNQITLGEQLLTNYTLGKISDQLNKETHGLYRVKGGNLYMTTSMDAELTDENYDTYQLNDNTLTLLECHCHMDEGFENISGGLYPITLTRVEE